MSVVNPSLFSNIFSSETIGPVDLQFHVETPHGVDPTKFIQNDGSRLTLTYLMSRSNLFSNSIEMEIFLVS